MKDKKLYNYVVNTLGISKELILEYIDSRMESLIAKHVHNKLNSNKAEQLILDAVTNQIKHGTTNGHFSRTPFETYFKSVVKQVIEEKLNETYEIDVKMIQKDKKVIGKAP